jgi:hypothetical protein
MPKRMTTEADRILNCFRERGLRAGAFIHFTDFGDAIVWEKGFVRDEPVRRSLVMLMEHGLLMEMSEGLELTERGAWQIYDGEPQPNHGARVCRIGGKLLIKQTVLRGTPPEYVIERERHVCDDDDVALAAAIRDALSGRL